MVRYKRILVTTVGIGGLLALSVGTGTLHAQALGTTQTTATAVTSSATSPTAGTSLSITATVTPTPNTTQTTGTVQFMDGSVALSGPVALAPTTAKKGAAVLATTALTEGTHSLSAVYSGDATSATSTSPMFSQVVTGPNTRFVNAAYVTMLPNHGSDAAGMSYWIDQLTNHGVSRFMLSMVLATSPEYRNAVISGIGGKDFYHLYLNRPFDAAGANYWVGRMAGSTGMAPLTFEQVRLNFVGSPEFFATTSGGSKATAISNLYNMVLGRTDGGASDPTGTSYWMNHYDATVIASQFLFSQEGRNFLVNGLYNKILNGRNAEPQGLTFWTNLLLSGASDENIIGNILSSDEYLTYHP